MSKPRVYIGPNPTPEMIEIAEGMGVEVLTELEEIPKVVSGAPSLASALAALEYQNAMCEPLPEAVLVEKNRGPKQYRSKKARRSLRKY